MWSMLYLDKKKLALTQSTTQIFQKYLNACFAPTPEHPQEMLKRCESSVYAVTYIITNR